MSVFDKEEQTPATDPTQGLDASTTILNEIKNENGEPKYQSVEKALEALKHSQDYIPSLKTQLEERDEELAKIRMEMAKMEGVQSAMEKFAKPTDASQEQVHQTGVQEPSEQNLEALVAKQFEAISKQKQEQENVKAVDDAITKAYGERSKEFVEGKLASLGMNIDALESMVKTSPKAALTLLGVEGSSSRNVSSVNAGGQRNSLTPAQEQRVSTPEQSMLSGVSSKDRGAFMKAIQEEIYRDLGVQVYNP